MQRLFVVLAVAVVLSGCTSNPLSSVSGLPDKKLDEVSKVVFPYSNVSAPDDTPKLQHWKLTDQAIFTKSPEIAGDTLKTYLSNFEKYCAARDGKMSGPDPVTGTAQGQFASQVSCVDSSTNKTLFMVAGGLKGCSLLSRDNRHYLEGHRFLKCEIWVDAFSWKAPGQANDVAESFEGGFVTGFFTKEAANLDRQQTREANERRTAAAKAERERQMQAQQEADQRRREQAARDLPRIKTVGQKICKTEEITQRRVIGTALGQPMYGLPVKAKAVITAFTENSAGTRIQLRISGMQVDGQNLDRIDGDIVYENGSVVWEEASNWQLCN
jgi:hypothetical protein